MTGRRAKLSSLQLQLTLEQLAERYWEVNVVNM